MAIDHEEFNVQFDGQRYLKARFCPKVKGFGICQVGLDQVEYIEKMKNNDTLC